MFKKFKVALVLTLMLTIIMPPAFAEDLVMSQLTALRSKVGGLHNRLDSIDGVLTSLEQRVARCAKNQDDIEEIIAEVAAGDKEIEAALIEFTSSVREFKTKLDTISSDVQHARYEVQQANCLLKEANCILCKLPGNIRRAKVRAFIFGFMVGMGVSAAIGGGGGGVGAVSAGVW